MDIFILGFIFALSIVPLFDGLTSLILTFIEMLKSGMNVKINKNNLKIQQENLEVDEPRKIGFILPENIEGEEVYEDEDL